MRPTVIICRACGKKRFDSPRAADKRRRLLKRVHGDNLHVYRCRYPRKYGGCRGWHLGHELDA